MKPGFTIPPLVKGVGGLILVGTGGYFGVKWWNKYKKDKQAADLLKLQSTSTVKGINATGTASKVNLAIVAADIYDAFHSNPFSDDEERALRALKNTPVMYYKQLSAVYQKVYDLNLIEDLRKYLSDEQFISVKYFFR